MAPKFQVGDEPDKLDSPPEPSRLEAGGRLAAFDDDTDVEEVPDSVVESEPSAADRPA